MSQRANPFVWTGEEAPQGVFIGADDGLNLLGLPQGMRRRASSADIPVLSERAREIVARAIMALRRAAVEGGGESIACDHLSTDERAALLDLLGEGEVTALIAKEEGLTQSTETIFPGLWILRDDNPAAPFHLEVGDCPLSARAVLDLMPMRILPLEHIVPPDGTMNVMGVLSEIRHLSGVWQPGEPNRILNFTLLPMTEPDADFLAAVLGQGPVRFASGGYGSARVIATAQKRVWAVQYLNSMGTVILDTVEVGDVPSAACAQPEDFEDSAQRLERLITMESAS
jgi:hydrogenase-1 operon protein HyaF